MIARTSRIGCFICCLVIALAMGCDTRSAKVNAPETRSASANGQSNHNPTTNSANSASPATSSSARPKSDRNSDSGSPSTKGAAGAAARWFDDVTSNSGVNFSFSSGRSAGEFAIIESLGGGVATFDYDSDGRVDLHCAGGGTLADRTVSSQACGLFRNLGEWRFVETTHTAGAAATEFYSHGIFPADWDNDGFVDVAISGYGGVQLLKNQGDGTFLQIPSLLTHPKHPWSSSLAWSDFDEDGVLDLYVAHYVDWSWDKHPLCPGINVDREVCAPREFAGVSDAIYFGTSDGNFHRRDREAGLVEAGKGLGVVAGDIDLDGDADIYVANDTVDNFYYVNDGHGHFEESAVLAGVAGDEAGVSTGSMGTCVFDANQDGLPDIWTVNFERELFALYRNEGAGSFSHVSRAMGLGAIEGSYVGFGTAAIDFDLDGDLDLVVANGHVSYASPYATFKQQPLLLENVNGRFTKVAAEGYFAGLHTGRGLACADFDDDGVLDMVISHLEEPVAILRGKSDTKQRTATEVRLIGRTSNRDAIGAVARFSTERSTLERLLMRNGGESYLSTSDSRLWLTGAVAGEAMKLRVTWPTGSEEVFVLADDTRQHLLVEGQSQLDRHNVP